MTSPESPQPAGTEPQRNPSARGAKDSAWVSTTYFAEGYPYSIINNLAEVLFKELGASLEVIGLTSLFHLPWNLKFLWAPFVDQFETKKRWIVAIEVALTVALAALALCTSSTTLLGVVSALFVLLALLSATHDIAIDGFYLDALDAEGQSKFVGFRAMAYKLASLLVRGPLLILIGWIGWRIGLLAAAAVMLLLTVVHARLLPHNETRKRPLPVLLRAVLRPRVFLIASAILVMTLVLRRFSSQTSWLGTLKARIVAVPWISAMPVQAWIVAGLIALLVVILALRAPLKRRLAGRDSFYAAAFIDFMARPKVGRVLAFVLLFRAGESFLQKMKWPFLRDVLHLSLDQYGFANGTLGVVASFAGTFAGGWLISRQGLERWIWPFAIIQNVLHLLYMGLAIAAQGSSVGLAPVVAVIMTEHFGEGLGTALFMVFLMRACDPAHKAAHMAILTALMSVSFTVAGVASGFLAKAVGFTWYFAFTLLAALPGMAVIPFLPHLKTAPRR